MFYAPLKIQKTSHTSENHQPLKPLASSQRILSALLESCNISLFASFLFSFCSFSGAPTSLFRSYKLYGISKLLSRNSHSVAHLNLRHIIHINLFPSPLPTVCFNSHLSVDKRAVQSYSVALSQGNNITCIPASSSSGSHKAGRGHVRKVFPPPHHPLQSNLA